MGHGIWTAFSGDKLEGVWARRWLRETAGARD